MNAGAIAIILGIIWVVAGFGFLLGIPFIINYEAEQYNEKITFAHSEHLQNLAIQMNFITFENDQHLWMRYVIHSFEKKSGFISVVLPYEGELVSGEGWQSKKFESGSTIIFKNFTCTEDSCPLDQGYVTFNFLKPITSFRSPNQYIQIPFSTNPIDNEIINFIRGLKSEERHVSFGWSNVDTEVNVIFDDQFDDWESQPTSKIKSFIKQDGKTNIILSWILEEDDSLFTAKYSRELDRAYSTTSQLFLGIGFGSGVTMIALGIALIRNYEELKELRNFVKIQRHIQDANTSFSLKHYDEAKKSYDLAIKIDEKNIDPHLLAGNSFYEMKMYEKAVPYYEKVLKIDDRYIGAFNNLGICFDKLEKFEDSYNCYLKAFEIDPNHEDTLNNYGALALDLEFSNCALPCFEEVLMINKKDVIAMTNKGRALKNISIEFAENKEPKKAEEKHEEAKNCFEVALSINPNCVVTLTLLGHLFLDIGRYNEALSCFRRANKVDPLEPNTLYNIGICLLKLKKHEEALSYFDEYVVLNPTNIPGLGDRGATLSMLNRDIEAIEMYNKILEINPNDLDAKHNRDISYKKLKQY